MGIADLRTRYREHQASSGIIAHCLRPPVMRQEASRVLRCCHNRERSGAVPVIAVAYERKSCHHVRRRAKREFAMRVGKFIAAAVAATLAAAPALADNPASSLSLAPSARAGSTSNHHKDDLLGGGLIIAVVAAAAVIVGVGVGADDNGSPSSP